jgi:hypothetical protein
MRARCSVTRADRSYCSARNPSLGNGNPFRNVVSEVRKVEFGGMREEARCKCTRLFGRLPLLELDQFASWFWLSDTAHNTVLNHMRQILSVTNPSTYRRMGGIGRDYRMWGAVSALFRKHSSVSRRACSNVSMFTNIYVHAQHAGFPLGSRSNLPLGEKPVNPTVRLNNAN